MHIKTRGNQQGFAHIGLVVGAVVFIGLIGFIAWRVWDAKTNSPAGKLQQALANVKCDISDKDLCKFFTSWKQSASYKVASSDTTGGKTTTSTFESADSGKRFHVLMSVEGKPYETITIGNTVYTKDSNDGKWWKQTIEPAKENDYKAGNDFEFKEPAKDAKPEAQTQYKLIGKEACGNLTCFKYQVIDPATKDQTQYIWFDTKDYQLRRMRTETKDTVSDQTFLYDKVAINEPSPVKELGPNQVINPASGEPITVPNASDVPLPVEPTTTDEEQ